MAAQTPSLMVWLLAAVAVLCNAGAQVLIKQASAASSSVASSSVASDATSGAASLWGLNPMSLAAALALYALSFVLTAWVYARLPLSVASPLMPRCSGSPKPSPPCAWRACCASWWGWCCWRVVRSA
ncbi:MAG: hypothetical protein EBU07_16730 [Betaproteobacteria bacterium]|nr:hypothetical protein [Betaproteobacteria bacterium]